MSTTSSPKARDCKPALPTSDCCNPRSSPDSSPTAAPTEKSSHDTASFTHHPCVSTIWLAVSATCRATVTPSPAVRRGRREAHPSHRKSPLLYLPRSLAVISRAGLKTPCFPSIFLSSLLLTKYLPGAIYSGGREAQNDTLSSFCILTAICFLLTLLVFLLTI